MNTNRTVLIKAVFSFMSSICNENKRLIWYVWILIVVFQFLLLCISDNSSLPPSKFSSVTQDSSHYHKNHILNILQISSISSGVRWDEIESKGRLGFSVLLLYSNLIWSIKILYKNTNKILYLIYAYIYWSYIEETYETIECEM